MLSNLLKTILHWKTQYDNFLEVECMHFDMFISIISILTCALEGAS